MAEPRWARCYWSAFSHAESPALHFLGSAQAPRACFALARSSSGQLSNCANDHVPAFALQRQAPTDGIDEEVLTYLASSAPVVELGPLYADDPLVQTARSPVGQRLVRSVWSLRHPEMVARLEGPWEEARKHLSGNATTTAARRMRQLERQGRIEMKCVSEGDVGDIVEECLALEASGWKGDEGTAIVKDPETAQFYRSLAREYAAAGRLALYILRLDDRLVAFQYCIRTGNRLDLLKMSFAEDLAAVAPGNVLRLMSYQYELATYGRMDMYLGRTRPWKEQWGNVSVDRGHLFLYNRSVRGTFAYLAGPALRKTAKQIIQRTGIPLKRKI
jgi:CelD/BcsL family acetyltransferase involved in cellulose biosynthesis